MATDLETLVVSLSANIKTYENAMNRASGIMNRQAREIERRGETMQKRLDGIGRGAANGLIAPLSSIGAALGVREIANYADAWTNAGNKIRAAATASNVQVRSLNDLKAGANAARTDLESYVDLYAKLIRNASGVAKSEQEIATVTETVSKAFKVGGASTSEQTAAILQLGQALGSGVLQGDELRSIRENAPVVAKAIAAEMGVSISQLKELGAEGKITSDIVFRALLNAQDEVERQFKSTNATISDGLTNVNNEFLAYIGNADASSGASRGLVTALLALSTNFGVVADSVVVLSTLIIGALTGRALAGMVVTLGQAVTALGALLTALRAGAPIAATFTAALGPIGILAGLAAAALLLLSYNQETADKAAQEHKKAIDELKTAFGLAQSGADGAKESFAGLARAHIESAKAAVANADAQLQAAKAVQLAGQTMAPAFGEAAGLAAGQQGFNDEAVTSAIAKLEARKAELADLETRLANPAAGLSAPTAGYGTGAAAAPAAKVGRKTADDKFREDLQGIKDRTAALAAEQQMIGQSVAAQESRRAQLDLEAQALADLREEARRKGETDLESVQLAPEQIAKIKEVADAYGQQAESLQRAQQTFGDLNDLGKDALSGFISDIREGVSAADALSNALDRVLDKLLDMALNSLFSQNGGIGGGLFGALGSALGFDEGGYTGPGGKNQPAGVVHKGEVVWSQNDVRRAGGVGVVEAMRHGRRGYASGGVVLPSSMPTKAPTLPRMSSGAGARSSTPGPISVSIDLKGANGDATIAQIAQAATAQGVQQALAAYDKRLLPNIQTQSRRLDTR